MKLYLDTHERDQIVVGIDGEMFTTNAKKEKSQKLLPFIDETLKKKNKEFKDVTEIEVHTGPGSFTGLRVGVAVANVLGWVLGVPVNGKRLDKGETVDIEYENK